MDLVTSQCNRLPPTTVATTFPNIGPNAVFMSVQCWSSTRPNPDPTGAGPNVLHCQAAAAAAAVLLLVVVLVVLVAVEVVATRRGEGAGRRWWRRRCRCCKQG